MGKVDDQRAMREAKYASRQRSAAGSVPATPPRAAAARTRPISQDRATDAPAVTVPASAASDELCGHRSIGNKSCTREKGHQATGTKNHRYG